MEDLSCPVCASRLLKVREVTKRIVIATCAACGTVMTINKSALTVHKRGAIHRPIYVG